MKNSMIIAGIVVIAIIAVAVYLLFSMETGRELSFKDGLNEVNSLWEKNEVEPLNVLDEEKINLLSEEKLESLYNDLKDYKENLKQFNQTQDVKALNSYIDIQLLLVEELRMAKEIKEDSLKLSGLETDAEVCANLSEITSLSNKTTELNNKMLSINNEINSFIDSYPEQAEESLIINFLANETTINDTKEYNESFLNDLKEACSA